MSATGLSIRPLLVFAVLLTALVACTDGHAPASSTPGGPVAHGSRVTACAATQMTARLVGENGGAGTNVETVALTNSSRTPCTVNGYPVVAFLSASGQLVTGYIPAHVVQTVYRERGPRTIVVTPDGRVAVQITVSDTVVGDQCAHATEADAVLPAGVPAQSDHRIRLLQLSSVGPRGASTPGYVCAVVSVSPWEAGDGRYWKQTSRR